MTPSLSKEINLCVGFDARFAYPALVTVHSIHSQLAQNYTWVIGVIDGQVSESDLSSFCAALNSLQIPHEVRRYPDHTLFTERRHLTKSTFLKLRISDDVKGALIWFDTDMCAVADIGELIEEVLDAPGSVKLVVADFKDEEFNAGLLGWTDTSRAEWEDSLAALPTDRKGSEQPLFNEIYRSSKKTVSSNFNVIWEWLIPHSKIQANPVIIHFTGGYKPWHLPEGLKIYCANDGCPWNYWFSQEQKLLEALGDDSPVVTMLAQRSQQSARIHRGPAYVGFLFARLLDKLGPASKLLIFTMRWFRPLLPFALHPIHGTRSSWRGV